MYRYILVLCVLCFGNAAYAENIENEQALSVVYNTKIAGIGLESSVEDIKAALAQDEIPMDCQYTERTSSPRTKLNKKLKKDSFYQNWNCKYIDGMKSKTLDVRTVNGFVMLILYRGSMLSSLDNKDMFAYYSGVNQQLLNTGIQHKDHTFVFTDMGADVSPKYQEQRLMLRQSAYCKDGVPVSVLFEENLTNMPVQNAFRIEVKYERSCSENLRIPYTK